MLSFILTLYANPNLPRNIVDIFVTFFDNFLKSILVPQIEKDIFKVLESENISEFGKREIKRCLNGYSEICNPVNSESKRVSLLKCKGLVDFEKVSIGVTLVDMFSNGKNKLAVKELTGVCIPLKHSLKCFLEIPGLFNKIVDYIQRLQTETNVISNIIQASLWKVKYASLRLSAFQLGFIVLPLYIFYDDLECGNAFGSHAGVNKFGAVYVMLACLPPEIASRLSSIIFSSLFNSSDVKESTDAKVFKNLIDELNDLRKTGITINVNGVVKRVKFQLILLLGDNLGLNTVLGFVTSFRSHFYCRICQCSSKETDVLTTENESKLRTINNYKTDLQLSNFSKTGIKEECAFHRVDGYNMDNVTVDLLHDWLEGVLMYVFNRLIRTFLEKGYFSLSELNARLKNFNYGSDNLNKPPPIKMEKLYSKQDLKMSAAEMLILVRYFGLIIGDKIPVGDNHYELYIYLAELNDIFFSQNITKDDSIILKEKIQFLLEAYKKYYGSLKPKMHFLTHYPKLLLKNGPFVNFWGARFESSHKSVKSTVTSTSNKQNLKKTVAMKQCFIMCKVMHDLQFEESIILESQATDNLNVKLYFSDAIKNSLCTYYKKVSIEGIPYKIGTFLVLKPEPNEVENQFGKIIDIVRCEEKIYFYFEIFKEFTFDRHVHAYMVENFGKKKLIEFSDLPRLPAVMCIKIKNTIYVISKSDL